MSQSNINRIYNLSKLDKKSLTEKTLKLSEEVGEVARAVLPYEQAFGTSYRFSSKEDIVYELADTYLVIMSILSDLDISHDMFQESVTKKLDRWENMVDSYSKDVFPFELHVTVDASVDNFDLELFKSVCTTNSIKPIVIELTLPNSVLHDVMTSSKIKGTNRQAHDEALRIAGILTDNGFKVVRKKIESFPWHPLAPKSGNLSIPEGRYFESHIGVKVNETSKSILSNLKFNSLAGSAKLSKNAFKKADELGNYIYMLTYRKYVGGYDSFISDVDFIKDLLTNSGLEYEKVEVEFAIYDSNVKHDSSWIDA